MLTNNITLVTEHSLNCDPFILLQKWCERYKHKCSYFNVVNFADGRFGLHQGIHVMHRTREMIHTSTYNEFQFNIRTPCTVTIELDLTIMLLLPFTYLGIGQHRAERVSSARQQKIKGQFLYNHYLNG